MDAPWPLALARTGHLKSDTNNQKMQGSGAHTERERQGHRDAEGPVTGLPGANRYLRAGQGRQQGGDRCKNVRRIGHVARGAETSGGSCWVAGVEDF